MYPQYAPQVSAPLPPVASAECEIGEHEWCKNRHGCWAREQQAQILSARVLNARTMSARDRGVVEVRVSDRRTDVHKFAWERGDYRNHTGTVQ